MSPCYFHASLGPPSSVAANKKHSKSSFILDNKNDDIGCQTFPLNLSILILREANYSPGVLCFYPPQQFEFPRFC